MMLVTVGTTADACTSIEIETSRIERGERCALGYLSPDLAVRSGLAERLTDRLVRQFITVGSCEGEQIAAYYDCQDQNGVWLGGEYNVMGIFSPEPNSGSSLPEMISGPAAYFVRHEEPQLGPDLTVEALAAKARDLSWIAQSGRLSQSRITVEGKPFDLSCGCRLSGGR